MLSRRITIIICAVVIVAGTAFTMLNVDRSGRLRDIDEAAWLFNGYYLDLYATGRWDDRAWNEFDMCAQHPPAANYLFGALLHAIGEPMKSMEPRRFWFR